SVSPTVRSGGSRDPGSVLKQTYIGGNKQLLFNFELEFPIFEKVGIRGVLFYDAGNVFARNENFFDSQSYSGPLGLLHSVGAGFRWFSPIGPLRFEWGIPLTRRPGDDAYLFEFTIVNFF
ncbi:MAG: BamA/TamA family outer membrane protein, partial [Deltaproteobacteria bacterium]|nr:BamA/TamA family outer membrane protein [Deltaproteobacteria bacterium]